MTNFEIANWFTIALTAGFIMGVASLAALAWLFDKDDLPEEKVNDENDHNHRTG